MPDRAYWISWYDLPQASRAALLDWTHAIYIPKVLALPGVLWGAHYEAATNVTPLGGGKGRVTRHAPPGLPQGKGFILIFGAAEPHVFADPGPAAFHAGLTDHDREMLAMREGERRNLMVDEARVIGPEGDPAHPDAPPAPAIQLGSFNSVSPDAEPELATWYAQWRMPSISKVPGIVRVRKLISVAGWAKHACWYEFTSLEERAKHFVHYEDDRPDMVKWSTDVVEKLVHATPGAIVGNRIWPPAG